MTEKRYGHTRWFHTAIETHENDMSGLWSWKVYDSRLPKTDTNWFLSSGGCESADEALAHATVSIERQINELRRTVFYRPKHAVMLTRICECCGASHLDSYSPDAVFSRLGDSFIMRRKGYIADDEYYNTASETNYEYEIDDFTLSNSFDRYYPLGPEAAEGEEP